MSRVIVLILCLASAGGIAVYTHYFSAEPAPVYTVVPRAPEAVVAKQPPPASTIIERPADRASLARALQRELKRVGCYDGEITGVWTTSSRMAMKAFTERVNAALPIEVPDQVLLSLVQGHQGRACGTACAAGQSATASGVCVPNAVLAKAAKPPAPTDVKSGAATDKSTGVPPPGLAAALVPKPQVVPPADKVVPPAARVVPPADKKAPGERIARTDGGPVPPEGVRERRQRRSGQAAASRPPKVVRDFLRVFGVK